MKKIIFLFLIIICIPFVSAGEMTNEIINNTNINLTIFVDRSIRFTDLIDNTTGIYFINILPILNNTQFNCSPSIEIENITYNTSEFPLSGWNCTILNTVAPIVSIVQSSNYIAENNGINITWDANGILLDNINFTVYFGSQLLYESNLTNGTAEILNLTTHGIYISRLYANNSLSQESITSLTFEVGIEKSRDRLEAERLSAPLIAAMILIGLFVIVGGIIGIFVIFTGDVSPAMLLSAAISGVGIAIAIIIFFIVRGLLLNLM